MAITQKPKNPSVGMAAMRAMGASPDLALARMSHDTFDYHSCAQSYAEETWQFILTKSKDQDIVYYFLGLYENPSTRHFLVENFRKDFEPVSLADTILLLVLTVAVSSASAWRITSACSTLSR